MANSYSSNTTEKSIYFNNTDLLKNASWSISSGTGVISDQLVINSDSVCSTSINSSKYKVSYVKIICDATYDDDSVSTDSSHKLCIECKINEKTDNGNEIVTELFFPKFDFEELLTDGTLDNYTIIAVDNCIINSIEFNIYNSYEDSVTIKSLNVYYSKTPINSDDVSDIVDSAVSETVDTTLQDSFNDYYKDNIEKNGTYIEVRTTDPSSSELYDGRIWLREDLIEE